MAFIVFWAYDTIPYEGLKDAAIDTTVSVLQGL